MKTRILYITNYKKGVGGISGQVEILMRKMSSMDYSVGLFNTQGSFFERIQKSIYLFSIGSEYQVFHIHACSGLGGFFPAMIGVLVGRITNKKVIVTYHGGGAEDFFKKRTKLVRYILCRAEHVIVLSGFLKCIFDKYAIPSIIIPNIIDIDDATRRNKKLIEPKFISIRSLYELYNISCIIDAFSQVQHLYAKASLIIVGSGPEELTLKAKVAELRLNNVSFIGRVKNGEIESYLREADVMLSSPVIDNMPVSILEGFKAGLVVISSNVGGVPYLIDDNVTGVLFESNKPEQLAEKMIEVLNEQERSLAIITNAWNGLGKYSWVSVSQQLLPLYAIN